jgi:coproporphyrinogen III oxidase-like Fe-S oxidoreductase
MAAPAAARDGEEHLGDGARAEEWLSLRLRLMEIDLDEARARLGGDLTEHARALQEAGLARVRDGSMMLTPRGMLLENEVTLRLLSGSGAAGDASRDPEVTALR